MKLFLIDFILDLYASFVNYPETFAFITIWFLIGPHTCGTNKQTSKKTKPETWRATGQEVQDSFILWREVIFNFYLRIVIALRVNFTNIYRTSSRSSYEKFLWGKNIVNLLSIWEHSLNVAENSANSIKYLWLSVITTTKYRVFFTQ